MSPKPSYRTLKKKPTASEETNKTSVDTEVDTSESIEQAPTTTKTTQTLPQPPTAKSTATTRSQLKEETANSASSPTEIATVTSERVAVTDIGMVQLAENLAQQYGLAALDALQVASAISVTTIYVRAVNFQQFTKLKSMNEYKNSSDRDWCSFC